MSDKKEDTRKNKETILKGRQNSVILPKSDNYVVLRLQLIFPVTKFAFVQDGYRTG